VGGDLCISIITALSGSGHIGIPATAIVFTVKALAESGSLGPQRSGQLTTGMKYKADISDRGSRLPFLLMTTFVPYTAR
jgi:hypothetical protein